MFRFVAAVCRNETVASTGGSFFFLVLLLLGGFLLARGGAQPDPNHARPNLYSD